MEKYRYEVHLHTKEASACSQVCGADYIPLYKAAGYDGIIVTDHFFRGNSAIDRSLPWEQWVDEYCKGYENAKAAGDAAGLKVFFGIEENFHGDEYLIYGIDKAWLRANPDIIHWQPHEMAEAVHKAGGLIVQAHPFRERGYLSAVNVHPHQVDAFEAFNFGNLPYMDAFASTYCREHGINMTSGGDVHHPNTPADSVCGMLFDKPLESIMDYVEAVKTGTGYTPMAPDDRRVIQPDDCFHLPVYMFDEKDEGHEVTIEEVFPNR